MRSQMVNISCRQLSCDTQLLWMPFSVYGFISNWIPREYQSCTSTVALMRFLTDRLTSNAENKWSDNWLTIWSYYHQELQTILKYSHSRLFALLACVQPNKKFYYAFTLNSVYVGLPQWYPHLMIHLQRESTEVCHWVGWILALVLAAHHHCMQWTNKFIEHQSQ